MEFSLTHLCNEIYQGCGYLRKNKKTITKWKTKTMTNAFSVKMHGAHKAMTNTAVAITEQFRQFFALLSN